MSGIAKPTSWLYYHSRSYRWLDAKLFEKARHKRVLKNRAATRAAHERMLTSPAYLADPDHTLD